MPSIELIFINTVQQQDQVGSHTNIKAHRGLAELGKLENGWHICLELACGLWSSPSVHTIAYASRLEFFSEKIYMRLHC
jgi:hypothetical protein